MTEVLISDPDASERFIAEREAFGLDRWDEVWDGSYIALPPPNDRHQGLATWVSYFLIAGPVPLSRGAVRTGVAITDREFD